MFAFLPSLGPAELAVLLGLGVLLFGRKLPDIGRSLGKTIVEFKKGFNGLEDEIPTGSSAKAIEPEPVRPPQRVTPSSPVFSDAAAGGTNLPPKI